MLCPAMPWREMNSTRLEEEELLRFNDASHWQAAFFGQDGIQFVSLPSRLMPCWLIICCAVFVVLLTDMFHPSWIGMVESWWFLSMIQVVDNALQRALQSRKTKMTTGRSVSFCISSAGFLRMLRTRNWMVKIHKIQHPAIAVWNVKFPCCRWICFSVIIVTHSHNNTGDISKLFTSLY